MTQEVVQEKKNAENKVKRLVTGWIVGLVALFSILAGGIYLFLLLLAVILCCSVEYCKILKTKGFHPSLGTICVADIVFALLILFHKFDELLPLVLTLSIITSFLMVLFKGRQPYIANVATTILGFMYCGWLPCHMLLLRQFESNSMNFFVPTINEGLYITITVFLTVIVTDIGAYFFGSRHGKHKLSPVISPKKTVEGAIGGAVLAILISMTALLYTKLTVLQCLLLGVITTVSAQLGDLSESLIKRDAGVKDSSNILPGHGGFLDRVDGYIFAAPVAYYYIVYFTHGTNVFLECFSYLKGLIGGLF